MHDTIEQQSTTDTVNGTGSTNEYVTFRLGKEEYVGVTQCSSQ